jgi:hypothetical protein
MLSSLFQRSDYQESKNKRKRIMSERNLIIMKKLRKGSTRKGDREIT